MSRFVNCAINCARNVSKFGGSGIASGLKTIMNIFSTAPVFDTDGWYFQDKSGNNLHVKTKNGYRLKLSGTEYIRSQNTIALGSSFIIKISGVFDSTSPSGAFVIGNTYSGVSGSFRLFRNLTNNYINLEVKPVGGAKNDTALTNVALFDNNHHDLEIRYTSGNIKVYLDTVLQHDYSITNASGFSAAYAITFAASHAGGLPSKGFLDYVEISSNTQLYFTEGQGSVAYDYLQLNNFNITNTAAIWDILETKEPYEYTIGCSIYQKDADSTYMAILGNKTDAISGFTSRGYFAPNSGYLPIIQQVLIPTNTDLNLRLPAGWYTYATLLAVENSSITKTMNGIAVSQYVVKKKYS